MSGLPSKSTRFVIETEIEDAIEAAASASSQRPSLRKAEEFEGPKGLKRAKDLCYFGPLGSCRLSISIVLCALALRHVVSSWSGLEMSFIAALLHIKCSFNNFFGVPSDISGQKANAIQSNLVQLRRCEQCRIALQE